MCCHTMKSGWCSFDAENSRPAWYSYKKKSVFGGFSSGQGIYFNATYVRGHFKNVCYKVTPLSSRGACRCLFKATFGQLAGYTLKWLSANRRAHRNKQPIALTITPPRETCKLHRGSPEPESNPRPRHTETDVLNSLHGNLFFFFFPLCLLCYLLPSWYWKCKSVFNCINWINKSKLNT